ncbi:hypothetical protein JCM8547_001297 [Rhodosporidiobolus lusitaniae]
MSAAPSTASSSGARPETGQRGFFCNLHDFISQPSPFKALWSNAMAYYKSMSKEIRTYLIATLIALDPSECTWADVTPTPAGVLNAVSVVCHGVQWVIFWTARIFMLAPLWVAVASLFSVGMSVYVAIQSLLLVVIPVTLWWQGSLAFSAAFPPLPGVFSRLLDYSLPLVLLHLFRAYTNLIPTVVASYLPYIHAYVAITSLVDISLVRLLTAVLAALEEFDGKLSLSPCARCSSKSTVEEMTELLRLELEVEAAKKRLAEKQ